MKPKLNKTSISDSASAPLPIFGYDRIEIWLDFPELPIAQRLLDTHCTGLEVQVRQMQHNARWKCKLTILQPTSQFLALLAKALGRDTSALVNYVEIACDLPADSRRQAVRLQNEFLALARIRYQRQAVGVRNDPALRADLNRWEPICRGYESAAAMRSAVRAMDAQAVAMGSIHSVKGGEWGHVFIVGVTDGLLPLYLARDGERSLVEERNLLYVAITRARDTVRLYHAPYNHARSRQQFDKVSRFLAEPGVRQTLLVA